MAEPFEIVDAIQEHFTSTGSLTCPTDALAGRRALVTSGPTHEPIDPIRYIANRSSGAQGSAIAKALIDLGAEVIFVTGPADVDPPLGARVIKVETAQQMLEAVEQEMPCDAAVFAAAVADWRVASAQISKIKKDKGKLPTLEFTENPDILATISQRKKDRPGLVVGFAAETDDVLANATEKRTQKGCDWIVANDVSPETGIMGGAENAVTLITAQGSETWDRMSKSAVARQLAIKIVNALGRA
jgi:phosphopantothenoylcysteine decarboxylase/phosphopantothenate--cysteine ligase